MKEDENKVDNRGEYKQEKDNRQSWNSKQCSKLFIKYGSGAITGFANDWV